MTAQQAAEAQRSGLSDWVKLSAAAADLYAVPGAAATLESARVAKLEQAYLSAKQAYSLTGGKSAGRSVYTELKAAKKDALITVGVLALALCAFIGFGSAAVMFVYSLRPEFFGEHQARLSHKKTHRKAVAPARHQR